MALGQSEQFPCHLRVPLGRACPRGVPQSCGFGGSVWPLSPPPAHPLLSPQCLDASRPWLCYWILHSLELLEEPIPQAVASE